MDISGRAARFFFLQNTQTRKIYQKTRKYTKWQNNTPNGRKIDQMAIKIDQYLTSQDTPKFSQFWIFGLKIYHLATLISGNIFKA
jgi:hypothetical protein